MGAHSTQQNTVHAVEFRTISVSLVDSSYFYLPGGSKNEFEELALEGHEQDRRHLHGLWLGVTVQGHCAIELPEFMAQCSTSALSTTLANSHKSYRTLIKSPVGMRK